MKIFWLAILVVIVAASIIRFSSYKTNESRFAADQNKTATIATENPKSESNGLAPGSLAAMPGVYEKDFTNKTLEEKMNLAMETFSKQVDKPIKFYGRVADENGNVVAGASVGFVIAHYWKPEGTEDKNAFSDERGLFSLKDVSGFGLSVSVGKQGWHTIKSKSQNSFSYSEIHGSQPFRPDQNNPIIFYLHKKGEGVDLITSQYGIRPDFVISTPKDGTPVQVDLLQRKIEGSGPLKIQSWLEIDSNTGRAKTWQLKLRLSDGGFIAEHDEFPFEAPENGYETELSFPIPDANGNIQFGVSQKKYYIAFGIPRRYGHLEISASDQTGEVMLQYSINPDGTRNLEPK